MNHFMPHKNVVTKEPVRYGLLLLVCLMMVAMPVSANPAVSHNLTDHNTGTLDHIDLAASRIVIGDITYKLAIDRVVFKKNGEKGSALDLKVGDWVTFKADSYRVNGVVTTLWVLSKKPSLNTNEEE